MRSPSWLGALLFLGAQLRALWPVAAVEVHTSREVDAVNGTNLRLKCTFSSSSPISQHLSVTWNFQPEDLSAHEPVSETFTLHFMDARVPKPTSPQVQRWVSLVTTAAPGVGRGKQSQNPPVFYYLKEPYKLSAGRFKERVTWDGNIERNDVSIVIWNLQPTDNGTFTCQVKNPPDVDGPIGEVRLRVVQKVHFSEIHFLAVAIGSACVLMIIVVTVVIICRHHRKKAREKRTEGADTELSKEKESLKEKEAGPLED